MAMANDHTSGDLVTSIWRSRLIQMMLVARSKLKSNSYCNSWSNIGRMITVVAGSRDIIDYDLVATHIRNCPWPITKMVTGGARGVDRLAEQYALEHQIPNTKYLAQWSKHGNAAGPIRNELMARNAEAVLAIWDGKSSGTKNMIATAKRYQLKLLVIRTDIKPIDL